MRLRQHFLVFLFYLAVTVVITYPLITVIGTRLIGHPFGDAYEYTHHIWWIKTALQTGQNPFFMPNLVYPNGLAAPLLWSVPLQSFPAWLFAFVLPLPTAFNISALLTLALNGWAMFFLARWLIERARHAVPLQIPSDDLQMRARSRAPLHDSTMPALLAGLVFMLYPAFQGQLGAAHVGLLTLYPIPLYVYMLLRLRDVTRARRWIVGGALLFMVSLWGSILLLIYLIAPITGFYLLTLLAGRDWRALRRALAVVVLGAIFALPFVLPLAGDTLNTPPEAGAVRYSADLLGVVSPSFYHPLFSSWDYNRRVLGLEPFETASYIGVVAAALALVGVWKTRAARGWLLLALVAWVFSLGPLLKVASEPVALRVDGYTTYITLPWALFQNLPLVSIARTPARFNFAVGFAVAVLAGYGVNATMFRVRKLTGFHDGKRSIQWIIVAILATGIAGEYQFWWGLPTIPGVVPEPIAALAARDDIRAVFDIPGNHLLVDKDGMFLQTGHHHPMITGQVARRSPVNPAKVELLQQTLDPALLRAAGADVVIVHREYDEGGALEARARQQLGDPIYTDAQFAVFETPPTDETPSFMALPTDANAISTQADSYIYAPQDGWVTLSARLAADDTREVALLRDAVIAQRWTVEGSTTISVPIPVSENSFQTISLALDPTCPEHFDAALECRTVALADVALDFMPASPGEPVTFERGVTLANAYVPTAARAGDLLAVWLWWQFDQPRDQNDIRFVHLTDAAGRLVGQQDNTLGVIAAGETRDESVEIALPADLSPGEYTISAGWYTYPDITNFCVLMNDVCGERSVTLGTVTVDS